MRSYQISEPINGRLFYATLDEANAAAREAAAQLDQTIEVKDATRRRGIDMLAKIIRAVAVTTACVITWGGNARAEILITTAAITRGELKIVGRVGRPREPSVHIRISPNKTVQVESNSTGGFRRGPA